MPGGGQAVTLSLAGTWRLRRVELDRVGFSAYLTLAVLKIIFTPKSLQTLLAEGAV